MQTPTNKKACESAAVKPAHFNPSGIKAALLAGHEILLISYPPSHRAQVIGALAALRDELPISCRWLTLRESHLSETRLRARAYRIRGEFLRGMEVSNV
jgi:hypothetical protein